MKLVIEKSQQTGFCFGVKRAIDILEKVAGEKENHGVFLYLTVMIR